MEKCEKCRGLIKQIDELQKFIRNFRKIQDKFNLSIGQKVYVEYESKVEGLRTAFGLFECETKTQIIIRVNDGKSSYRYYIKKKLINGMKEYYTLK